MVTHIDANTSKLFQNIPRGMRKRFMNVSVDPSNEEKIGKIKVTGSIQNYPVDNIKFII